MIEPMRPGKNHELRKYVAIIFLVVAVIGISYIVYPREITHEEIAVVTIQGTIVSGEVPPDSGYVSSVRISKLLMDLKENESVKGIVIRVNSPGGTPSASQEIMDAVEKVRERKPVVVSFGDIATSGAYYAVVPATIIYSNPDTVTGNIGVIWIIENKEGKYSDEGIKYYIYKSGQMKDMGAPWRAPTEEEEEWINQTIHEIFKRMVDQIVNYRNLTREEVAFISDGKVMTGAVARQHGLVDRLGTLEDAIDAAKELAEAPHAEVHYYGEDYIESGSDSQISKKARLHYLEMSPVGFPEA